MKAFEKDQVFSRNIVRFPLPEQKEIVAGASVIEVGGEFSILPKPVEGRPPVYPIVGPLATAMFELLREAAYRLDPPPIVLDGESQHLEELQSVISGFLSAIRENAAALHYPQIKEYAERFVEAYQLYEDNHGFMLEGKGNTLFISLGVYATTSFTLYEQSTAISMFAAVIHEELGKKMPPIVVVGEVAVSQQLYRELFEYNNWSELFAYDLLAAGLGVNGNDEETVLSYFKIDKAKARKILDITEWHLPAAVAILKELMRDPSLSLIQGIWNAIHRLNKERFHEDDFLIDSSSVLDTSQGIEALQAFFMAVKAGFQPRYVYTYLMPKFTEAGYVAQERVLPPSGSAEWTSLTDDGDLLRELLLTLLRVKDPGKYEEIQKFLKEYIRQHDLTEPDVIDLINATIQT